VLRDFAGHKVCTAEAWVNHASPRGTRKAAPSVVLGKYHGCDLLRMIGEVNERELAPHVRVLAFGDEDRDAIVEPVASAEKLQELLNEEHESSSLDYKSTIDLSQTRDVVELAKAVGAMQIDGGYVVIGADDQGAPTGEVSDSQDRLWDEAVLRKKLAKYVPEPFEIRSATHLLPGGQRILLLYVGPSVAGFCIFKADGNYAGAKAPAFRAGDVFARHGSASEPWAQADIERIKRRLVLQKKEAWRQEYRDELRSVTEGAAAKRLAQAPAKAFTWRVDADAFTDMAIEQLRGGDEIPLRMFLSRVGGEAAALLEEPKQEELGTLLDRLACLAVTLLSLERTDLFNKVIEALVDVYNQGFDSYGATRRDLGMPSPALWLSVIERVIVFGSLAVRRRAWDAVRDLALQTGEGREFTGDYEYNSWIRHSVTSAARSNLFSRQTEDGRMEDVSLLSLSLQHVRTQECLRGGLRPDDERLLNSMCQFDALVCLASIGQARSLGSRFFYPNFARFYSHRTEPAFRRIIEDDTARMNIFPGVDGDLAAALRGLDEAAQPIGWKYNGWHGFSDSHILDFLRAHPIEQESPSQ
jgi:hypothetical protein